MFCGEKPIAGEKAAERANIWVNNRRIWTRNAPTNGKDPSSNISENAILRSKLWDFAFWIFGIFGIVWDLVLSLFQLINGIFGWFMADASRGPGQGGPL